jgi:hypothetical protein
MLRGSHTGRWYWRPIVAWCHWVSDSALQFSWASTVFLINIWNLFMCTVSAHEEPNYSPSLMKSSHVPFNCTVSKLDFVLFQRTRFKMDGNNLFRTLYIIHTYILYIYIYVCM